MIKSALSPPSRQVATSPPSSAPPPIVAPTQGGTYPDPMAPRLTGASVAMAKSAFATGRLEFLVLDGLVMCCPLMVHLTQKLRGRTKAPHGAEGAKCLGAQGANQITHHGPFQRLLEGGARIERPPGEPPG